MKEFTWYNSDIIQTQGGCYIYAIKLPRYTLRIDNNLLEKIKYIAESEGRSANKEIEQLIKKHVENL
ncbi:Arc family DNA-binding protein [Clostridioides difficile]|uniref:Arc family DNA-binding protein n=1 Tax=Clostridioides difficile TaxID=1496 RepID=UPI002FE65333